VTVQLVKASDGYHLWSQRFDREMTDIFAIQDEISQAIVEKLCVRLAEDGDLSRRRAVDPEAFQLYLKGQYYWNKTTSEGVLKGMECFQQAIDKDPSYALAYSWLSNCYSMLGVNYRPPHETFPKAKALALKALELDSAIPEPHVSIAAGQLFYDWDWAGAGYHLDRAIALSPSNAIAHELKAYHSELMGRPDEAMSEILRAQELDPLALVVNLDVGVRHYFARRYDRAIEQYQGVREVDPNAPLVSFWLWLAYEQQGDYSRALAELRKLSPAAAGSETGGSRQGPLTRESYMAALWEERPKLQGLRDRRVISAGDVAAIHTSLGETDLAFEWLEKAYQDRDSRLSLIKLDPRFDALRADARFEGLLRRMNLHP
jgi:tetratricopeptide (TPR) repeat protein